MTPLDILTRVELHGGEFTIRDGRLVLTKAKGVPRNLVSDIRKHREQITAIVADSRAKAASTRSSGAGDLPRRSGGAIHGRLS